MEEKLMERPSFSNKDFSSRLKNKLKYKNKAMAESTPEDGSTVEDSICCPLHPSALKESIIFGIFLQF